jgi:hypothetical protein
MILFLGDSFTWGQGLYLPSWVERKPEAFDEILKTITPEGPTNNKTRCSINWTHQLPYIDDEDIRIKEELSFTGIVSKELGRICVKKANNGGSISGNINGLKGMIYEDGPHIIKLFDPFKKQDLIIVYQFSSIGREDIPNITDEEINLLFNNNNLSIKDVLYQRVKEVYDKVDGIFSEVERQFGYKTYYIDWFGDFYQFNPDKFVGINGNMYFNELIYSNPIKIEYKEKTIYDGHLNERANQLLGKAIIEKIQKDLGDSEII